jgi:hypothetical protein
MVSAGIPDQEIMGIGGFYTRSIFDRYFIRSPERQRKAAQRLREHLDSIE